MRFPLSKLMSAAAIAVLCALVPGQAEARFGKSGSSSKSSGGSHSSGSHSSSGSNSGRTHSASPVGSSGGGHSSRGGSSGSGSGYYRGTTTYRAYGHGYGTAGYSCWNDPFCSPYAWGFGYRPFWGGPRTVYLAPSRTYEDELAEPEQPMVVMVNAEGHAYVGGGAGLGVHMAIEKDRFGLEGRWKGIYVPADDGSGATDSIKLFDVHATYALLAGEHGRLRIGAGVDTAFAQDIAFAGPGLTLSGAFGLVGPVGLEGSLSVVPFPFIKVDWNAGLAIGLGPLGVRAGWRTLVLNDNGFVDGIAHEDVFSGPYVGLGLAI